MNAALKNILTKSGVVAYAVILIFCEAALNLYFAYTSSFRTRLLFDIFPYWWRIYDSLLVQAKLSGLYPSLYQGAYDFCSLNGCSAVSNVANTFLDIEILGLIAIVVLSSFLFYLERGLVIASINAIKFGSLSLIPLGLDIFIFDRPDWLNHVTTYQSEHNFAAWFNNAGLFTASVVVFIATSLITKDRWIMRIAKYFVERRRKMLIPSLVAAASSITLIKMLQNLVWNALDHDSASFLYNGLYLAGFSSFRNEFDTTRPPFVPTILAMSFKVTKPSVMDGYILSAVLWVMSAVGCYLLSRNIMSKPFAILAGMTFMISPSVYAMAGDVLTNVEGVGLGSLGFGLAIYAVREKRLNWLLLALPLMVCALFTRYTMGIFLLLFIFFIVAKRRYHILETDHFTFSAIISGAIGVGLGYIWTGGGTLTLRYLIPPSSSATNTHTIFGKLFYFAELPSSIGYGALGVFLVALFIVGTIYFLVRVRQLGSFQTIMLLWFGVLIIFYTAWANNIRYSTEFIMPVIILAFWTLYKGFEAIKERPRLKITLFAIVLISLCVSFTVVVATTSPWQGPLNKGMIQTAAWVKSNVSDNTTILGNDYTLLFWYLPAYHIYAMYTAPTTSSSVLRLAMVDNASLVEYSAGSLNSSLLVPLFTSTIGHITIYKVI